MSSLTPGFSDLHRENSAPLSLREGKRHRKEDCFLSDEISND